MRMFQRPGIPWDQHHDESRARIVATLAADKKDRWDRTLCRAHWPLFGHLARMPDEETYAAAESKKTGCGGQ